MKARKRQYSSPPARLKQAFIGFMDGYCDEFDDMSDGAWQCCCEEGVASFNAEFKTNIDKHDGWMYWIQHREG